MLESNSTNYINDKEDDSISYHEILFLVKKYGKLIILITFLMMLITYLYTSMQKSVYQSDGLIMIDDPFRNTKNVFSVPTFGEQNYLTNEIEILTSRTIIEKTIKQLLKSDNRDHMFLFGTRVHKFSLFETLLSFNSSSEFA